MKERKKDWIVIYKLRYIQFKFQAVIKNQNCGFDHMISSVLLSRVKNGRKAIKAMEEEVNVLHGRMNGYLRERV